jgi:multiple sugar transport system substrate-binding protein
MARTLTSLLAALLATLLTACGGGDSGADSRIRFLVFGDPEEIEAFRDVAAAYEDKEPDSDVELVEASDRTDLIARLSTSIAGGSPPDLFLMNYRYYGQFAAKGAIESMDDRLEGSDAFRAEDFYPQALEAFEWRGEQLCMPQNISSLAVYFNRDLFRRAGIADPRAGWTWTQLVAIAGRLTLDANGNPVSAGDPEAGGVKPEVYGLGVEPSLIRIAPFVWSNGGQLVDDDRRPTRFTLDTPQAQQALGEFFALRGQYGVVPSDVEVEAEDDETRFANGRLAMLLSSRRSVPTFRTIDEFEWDVAPLPVFKGPAGILHSDAYCMTAGSEHKDAAWKFVEFALGPEGQRITARTGRTVPSLVEASRSDAFLDPSQPPVHSQVFLDAIPTIRRVPSVSTWPEIEDASEPILENGMYLGHAPDRVARELDAATRPLFARGEAP